jgi:hypothetical protein
MENLDMNVRAGSHFKPTVLLNAETGVCEISGESYLEEASQFYKPIYTWLQEYIITKKHLTFNFRLSYVNTASSKHILFILRLLKDYQNNGGQVIANWFIEPGDTDTEEDVEDYMIISGLKIDVLKTE